MNGLASDEDRTIPHEDWHIMTFIDAILGVSSDQQGCIVEAGCFKGVSGAKFSLIARSLGRELHLFDSFEGLPINDEAHDKSIIGHSIRGWFEGGKYIGTYERVMRTLELCGAPEVCHLHKGWFENTMPHFKEPVVAAYLDCDLASSTKTCLRYIYPLLVPGGFIVSQDGDFPLVIDVFKDQSFWEKEVGATMPEISGLGLSKMIIVRKPI